VFWCVTLLVLVQAHEQAIVNVVWLPPEYGDAVACACADGTLSLWEEVAEGQLLFILFQVSCTMFFICNYLVLSWHIYLCCY